MGSNCISKFSRVQKTNVSPIQTYAPTQKALNNLQFETELPNPRQLNYWRRKLNKVCGQNCPNIPQQKFIELFNYSQMKQESLKKLYLIFKNQNELSNNVFQSKLKNIGSDSDQQLAQIIHYIYFVNPKNLQDSLNLFYIQLRNFIKEKPNQKMTSSVKSSLDSNQEFSQKQKKKLVDSFHSNQTIYDNRFTYDWIRKNINLRKFKYHLMEGNFKNDEMDAFKHFYHDRYTSQSRLGLVKGNQNQKLIIINWKWCEKMLQYMQSKYQLEGAPKIKKRQTLTHNSTLPDSKNLMFSKRVRNGSRVLDKIEPIQVLDLSLVTVKQKVSMNTSAINYFPNQIQNNYLIGDFRHELKRNIRKNVDYTAINQSTYDKLQLVFGGGPKIIRKVIQGYIQLRPFFIKSFYLKRDQNTGMQTLIEKQLLVISSFKPVNDFLPSQYKNYVCYHRNVGDQWNKFPFENLDKNLKIIDALTQTSFLIYVKSENQNDFKKRYIERGKKFCLGDIYSSRTYKFMDSTQERMSFNDEIQVCIINDQQEAFVQVTVLNWSHNIQRKIRTQQFQQNFTLVSKQDRILKGDRRGGIANLGNTCYMSSAIQAILSTIKQEYLNKTKGKLGIQLLELAKKLQKRKSVSPVDFKTTFDNYFQDFKGQEQHDAHQFCLRLFQQLQVDNKPIIQNILDLKLNFVSKCTKCQNKIQRIIPDFVVSVPIVDFAKRQVKIDYIINNLNIQTVQFTVKEDCTIDDWRRSFQKVSGAQNYYLCQVDDCRIKKTFNKQDSFQSSLFKDLNIQTHQLITAYQLTNYKFNTAKINNKYKFVVFKDSKGDNIIARVEAYEQEDSNNTSIERSLNGQKTERKCQILIQNESLAMEQKVVSQSQLLHFPQDLSNKQIYVKLINFDNTYGQRIGRPFIFKLPSHQPIQAIRLALQNCIGNRGYNLRLSPPNQISKCTICKQYSCSTSCFISRQDHAPICWVQGKLQFVVAWYNGFQYNSLIKRTKWVGSNSQINSNQFDSFQQSIKKYQQKEKLQLSLCQKCKQRNVEAQCRTLVSKWPDFLIIQIKRFSIKVDQIYKIHTKWKLEQSLIINKQKYNLKAVICHIGQSAECGHYVTISNGLLYDDQVVTQKRYEDIPPQYIYMLFYHKEA